MFHCFKVREDHRNYLRFFWYKDNNINNKLIEYRMCLHVFGNNLSPAVATYGLRKAAEVEMEAYGEDVKEFVHQSFYVDDSLGSYSTVDEAVSLMKRTQAALKSGGNLRLHKFASNSSDMLECFPPDDKAKDLKDLFLDTDDLPTQRSLWMMWDIAQDACI